MFGLVHEFVTWLLFEGLVGVFYLGLMISAKSTHPGECCKNIQIIDSSDQ